MTLAGRVAAFLESHEDELIAFRRNLHSHPEVSWEERQTTATIARRLAVAGLEPEVLPGGTGLVCDVDSGVPGPVVALRADIDALPIDDTKDVPYRSEVAGACHACGHDVHAAVVLGAGLALAAAAADLAGGRIRLLFQPAEESIPGGAQFMCEKGVVDDVDAIFALHCDPTLDVGRVGLRAGPVTAAYDRLEISLRGPGGHTARPHLTTDLVHVAARVVHDLPSGLARLIDVRGGVTLVFGAIHAGEAANVIPSHAEIRGTLRARSREAWDAAPAVIERLLHSIVDPSGAECELAYVRGSPPVDNDADLTALLGEATAQALGPAAVVPTEQSTGGEDFSWFLERLPGCYGRLGVRRPGDHRVLDLHADTFDVDEAAIAVGVRVLAAAAGAYLATR